MDAQPSPTDSPICLAGRLLLADPSLRDGIFDRSVVLLTDHSPEEGAFGLVLNHPTEREVGHFLDDEVFAPLRKLTVYQGGPVALDQLMFSAFWWSGNHLRWNVRVAAEEAVKLSHRPGTLVRAFAGYSGWSAGQLETELRRNAWMVVKPDAFLLGATHDRGLWAELLRRISPYHRIVAETPRDPWLN